MIKLKEANTLYICTNEKKEILLKQMSHDKEIFDIKFMTLNEFMEQYLDITPGSVSVMGLMNDIEHKVQLLIDEDILKKEYFGCHPCVNTSSLKFKTTDLMERIIPTLGHTQKMVRLG